MKKYLWAVLSCAVGVGAAWSVAAVVLLPLWLAELWHWVVVGDTLWGVLVGMVLASFFESATSHARRRTKVPAAQGLPWLYQERDNMASLNSSLIARAERAEARITEFEDRLQRQYAILLEHKSRVAELEAAQVCGACGQPWNGRGCAQKDNGHPFQTCYPVVDDISEKRGQEDQ